MKKLLNNIKVMKIAELLSLKNSILVSDGDQESKDIVLKAIEERLMPKKSNDALVELGEFKLGDIE